jgi:hypothetical protein
MSALWLLPVAILALFALWVLFLAVMCLQAARDRGTLTPTGLRFGYAVLLLGWLVDFAVQMLVATFLWAELPRELTVSQRVKRLTESGAGWRKALAEWFRHHLLKPFDQTGRHG